jgi:hypothetical protein
MSYFGSNLKEKVVLDIANRVSVGHCVDLDCKKSGELVVDLWGELRRKSLCQGPTDQMT